MTKEKIIMIKNEDGEFDVVDVLETRNEEIKNKLKMPLQQFLDEQALDIKGKKRFGYRFMTQLDDVLRSYGLMKQEDFAKITYEVIEDYWNKFRNLIAYYNLYFEIVPNMQLFCAFMGINIKMYQQLCNHDDEDIKNLIFSINDSFVGLGFMAGEMGNCDGKSIKMRLSAKTDGHSVRSATEDVLVQNAEKTTPQDLRRQLQDFTNKNLIGK